MADHKTQETHYEILKVPNHATISEIVAAYNTARNAFARDSVATYSLFSEEEMQDIHKKLEQAYLTLSNLEKKREYDRLLAGGGVPEMDSGTDASPTTHSPFGAKEDGPGMSTTREMEPHATGNGSIPSAESDTADGQSGETSSDSASITGQVLCSLREKRGLSVEDVARVTKIPSKFIRAIESEDPKTMPARVYVQGFVKNLANLYKIDASSSTKSYLEHIDKK